MKSLTKWLILSLLSAAYTSNLAAKPAAASAARPASLSIVDIVLIDDGEFDILQAAVLKAGLADALSGKKQLTVFAPTDAAFEDLFGAPEDAVIDVINNMDDDEVEGLTEILLHHVIQGRRISTSVLAAPKYKTIGGTTLSRDELAAAGLLRTDVSASNGIIHVIGGVLLPN